MAPPYTIVSIKKGSYTNILPLCDWSRLACRSAWHLVLNATTPPSYVQIMTLLPERGDLLQRKRALHGRTHPFTPKSMVATAGTKRLARVKVLRDRPTLAFHLPLAGSTGYVPAKPWPNAQLSLLERSAKL